ncbi:hypothetical protein Sta7437_1523 [Stanieria cyanosphaera PCC 7437]|uniref:Phosphate ABC transporter permease n=1 Tax=Stanieria cyanosphaera (strain ATCC 29371 / PCC 7437) TaxID=111780 RepID=K9XR60_STAC7|nr:hypothetical protein [Stanieria cyanosphaera]AFZ35090.1 hypothetical protein Sta7437_1523 [Stanieria cyanosphaera PCC 7437]
MLVSLTREKFEQIIPLIATGAQYAYYWGKWQDLLNRLLISVVAVVVILILDVVLGQGAQALILLLGVIAGLYWLWSPIYWASLRNNQYRRFPYSGFWRGRILEIFLTEDLIGEEETVNQRGDLVINEIRERRINLVIGDETGFEIELQAPLQRLYKAIAPGQIAELLVLSRQPNLAKIDKFTDAYIPSLNLWIGEYPYLQRDVFAEVSRQLGSDRSRANLNKNRVRKPPMK